MKMKFISQRNIALLCYSSNMAATNTRKVEEDVFQRIVHRVQGTTPLYCALNAVHGEVARLLIERGANATNPKDGSSLLELAAKRGLYDILKLLSDTDQVYFEKLEDGNTSPASAAGRGDFDAVEFLLRKGVDVNAKNLLEETALSNAITYRESPHVIEIVELLIAFGADINSKNHESETPLQIGCDIDFHQAAEVLLELGCEVKTKNLESYSPLHYAARNNIGKLAEMLLQYGADASVKTDEDEMTPLHLAVVYGSVHAAQVLLEHGVDVEATNKVGKTPLAVAASWKDFLWFSYC